MEGQTFLVQIRALFREPKYHSKRCLHVFDSEGSLGSLAKGRSSSLRINRVCRKAAALQLFADTTFFFSWANSEVMPMDVPSREFPVPANRVFLRYLNYDLQLPDG